MLDRLLADATSRGQGSTALEATSKAVAGADGLVVSGGGNLSSTWPDLLYERVALLNLARVFGKPYEHVHEAQQYGVKTAYAVGLIHGIGAETGTQVLVIATAVGAGSRAMGVAALGAFVVGLLISNSIVTVISTAGFVSSQRRQWIYVAAGLFAAVFSLVVGLFFLLHQADVLPNLDKHFRWIGGGS